MKKFLSVFVMVALLSGVCFFASCNSNESKKKSGNENQDFSSSGMIKEMEEMNKAAERGKPAAQPQPAVPQEHRK
ncbi:MAG: hypothetical protein ABFD63_00990 [Smithella sp.]|jgi:outer membrane murein-binding lipoprotein Lpp